MPIIEVNDVSFSYGNVQLLKDLNITVNEGSMVAIVGPFGSGKTTILRLLAGLISNYTGEIKIKGLTPKQAISKRKIGYSFQRPTLLPWRDVLQNILLPQEITGDTSINRAQELLETIGLEKSAQKYPHQLSGGMQQLVSIMRSLILDPDILLLDEPFSSIDEINRIKLQNELLAIHKKTKKTTVLVTHSLSEAVYLSDQVIVLKSHPGTVRKTFDIELEGRTEEILLSDKFTSYIKLIKNELSYE